MRAALIKRKSFFLIPKTPLGLLMPENFQTSLVFYSDCTPCSSIPATHALSWATKWKEEEARGRRAGADLALWPPGLLAQWGL